MDSTKRVLKFQNYGLKKSVGVFWVVILLVNVLVNMVAIYSIRNIEMGPLIRHNSAISFAGANMMSIFIFLIVYGIVVYHEDFALALNFGVTRKDFYKSVIVNNILVVTIFAVIQSVSQIIDKYVVESLGYKALVDFGLFNTERDSIVVIILVSIVFYLTILSITNFMGVLQYRFGYKFWIGFGITAITLQITSAILGFPNIYHWLWARLNSSTMLFLAFLIIAVCYTVGYFFIRKANIRK